MRNTARSFTLATAAVLVLFFGTAAPNALAQNDRRSGSAHDRFQAPQGNARGSRSDRQYRRAPSDSRRSFDRQPDRRLDGRRQGGRFDERRFSDRSYRRGFGDRFDGRRFSGRSYGRGFGDRFGIWPFVRPYRTVRVFVYFPFPHWVLRRVYDDRVYDDRVYDDDQTVVVEPNDDPY
jgi:hypothetical protein